MREKARSSIKVLAVGVWMFAFLGCASARPPDVKAWNQATIEAYLKTARVVRIDKNLEPGRSLPWRVTLDDGRIQARAQFKYFQRPRSLTGGHNFKYELAAYALSRILDLEIVPPVVEREVEGTKGALQWYLEGCLSERDRERTGLAPAELEPFLQRLAVVQVFEALVADECGDKDDTLIHRDDWRVCRVDFSEAFAPVSNLAGACAITRSSRRLYTRLQQAVRPALADRLRPYLSEEEIGGLCERKDRILSLLRGLIREKGESAVIF
jgi:hypothetical protein